jgi:hypothetical protein
VTLFESGRWPSIYDAESLRAGINAILGSEQFDARFFVLGDLSDPILCQGDIVELDAAAPLLDEDGQPIVTDATFSHWLVIGNTCDFDRGADVPTTQIAPLVVIEEELSRDEVGLLRRYEYFRNFYVPPWPGCRDQKHRLAELVHPVAIDRRAFRADCARVVARMQFPAWALFHACLVRFLARDDGRFD